MTSVKADEPGPRATPIARRAGAGPPPSGAADARQRARRAVDQGAQMDWNVIVTARSGPHYEHELLGALARFGRFRPTYFRDVCTGAVEDVERFLDAVGTALASGAEWTSRLGRVVPVEQVFRFTPEDFAARLQEAVAPLVDRMAAGSYCVRIERRGYAGELKTQEVERAVGDHVHVLAAAQGKALRTDLDDPDSIIAVETLGPECGVALLPRALRERYPFVQTR
jgi:tRNA(Ser,Leu) C12 N-acetylase TAN1